MSGGADEPRRAMQNPAAEKAVRCEYPRRRIERIQRSGEGTRWQGGHLVDYIDSPIRTARGRTGCFPILSEAYGPLAFEAPQA